MALDTRIKSLTEAVRYKLNSLTTLIDSKVASISAVAPIATTGGINPTLSITPASTSMAGSMSAVDKTKLDALGPLDAANTWTGAQTFTAPGGVLVSRFGDDASAAMVTMQKARGTATSPTAVAQGDALANFQGWGFDGSAYRRGGNFRFVAAAPVVNGQSIVTDLHVLLNNGSTNAQVLTLASTGNLAITGGLSTNGPIAASGSGGSITTSYSPGEGGKIQASLALLLQPGGGVTGIGGGLVVTGSTSLGNLSSGRAVIDQGGATNTPALFLNNVGSGSVGIHFARAAGGDLHLGSQDQGWWGFSSTNRSMRFLASDRAYDGSPQAFEFDNNNAASRDVMRLRHSGATTGTGNFLTFATNDATIVGKIDASAKFWGSGADFTGGLSATSANITGQITTTGATVNGSANITGALTAGSGQFNNGLTTYGKTKLDNLTVNFKLIVSGNGSIYNSDLTVYGPLKADGGLTSTFATISGQITTSGASSGIALGSQDGSNYPFLYSTANRFRINTQGADRFSLGASDAEFTVPINASGGINATTGTFNSIDGTGNVFNLKSNGVGTGKLATDATYPLIVRDNNNANKLLISSNGSISTIENGGGIDIGGGAIRVTRTGGYGGQLNWDSGGTYLDAYNRLYIRSNTGTNWATISLNQVTFAGSLVVGGNEIIPGTNDPFYIRRFGGDVTISGYNTGTVNVNGQRLVVSGSAEIAGALNVGGIVTAPTAAAGTNTTQLATTAFVTTATNVVPIVSYNLPSASNSVILDPYLRGSIVDVIADHAITVTVPADSTGFDIGSKIVIRQGGTGSVFLAAEFGVNIQTAGGLKIKGQYSAVELIKMSANTWWAVGALVS